MSEQTAAVIGAARAVVASEASRGDDSIPNDVWLDDHGKALAALAAALHVLDTLEASESGI